MTLSSNNTRKMVGVLLVSLSNQPKGGLGVAQRTGQTQNYRGPWRQVVPGLLPVILRHSGVEELPQPAALARGDVRHLVLFGSNSVTRIWPWVQSQIVPPVNIPIQPLK